MSDLHLAPPRENSRWPAILIAAVVLLLIAAVVYMVLPRSTAKITITEARIFAPHTVFDPLRKPGAGNVIGQPQQTEDDLYVVVTAAIKNQFHQPISVDGAFAALTRADGSVTDGSAVASSDLRRLDQIFPDLAALTPHALAFGDEIQPGKTVDKQVVVQFPGLTANDWQKKVALTVTVYMHNQPPQTVVLH